MRTVGDGVGQGGGAGGGGAGGGLVTFPLALGIL